MNHLSTIFVLIFSLITSMSFANSDLNPTLARLNPEIIFKMAQPAANRFTGYGFDSKQNPVTLHLRFITAKNDIAYYEGFIYDSEQLKIGDSLSERPFFAAFSTTHDRVPQLILTLYTQIQDPDVIDYELSKKYNIELHYEITIKIPTDLKVESDKYIETVKLRAVYGQNILEDEDHIPYWSDYKPASIPDVIKLIQKEIRSLKLKLKLPKHKDSKEYLLNEIHNREKRILQLEGELKSVIPFFELKSELFAKNHNKGIASDYVATGPIEVWLGDGCEKATMFLLKNEKSKTNNVNVVNVNFGEFFINESYDSEPTKILSKLFIREIEDTKFNGPEIPFTYVGPVTSYFQDLLEGYIWWVARKTGKLYLGRTPSENLEITSILSKVISVSKSETIDDVQYADSSYHVLKFTFEKSPKTVLVDVRTGEVKLKP